MFWAPLADVKGRRPVYIGQSTGSCFMVGIADKSSLGCLSLLSITCVAMALTPTNAWWLLLIFRCLQASGSASTVALGSGVVADVASPAERGSFYGATAVGALVRRRDLSSRRYR